MCLVGEDARYICGDGRCLWVKDKDVAAERYPHYIDVTDMTSDELGDFLMRGGDKVTAQKDTV